MSVRHLSVRPLLLVPALFLLLMATASLLAQSLTINLVPTPGGTYGGSINSITQDPQGYMWFGTANGLHRYDGYRFVSYFHEPLQANSLATSHIISVLADRKGIIWVGTFDHSLDRLDPTTGIFTHFRYDPNDPASLSDNLVTAIVEDRQGTIWVGTHGGLNRLDPRTGKFTRYRHDPTDPNSLSHDQVRALYEDRQGTLWVGTGSGFVSENETKTGGLNRFDRQTNQFVRYLPDPTDPHRLIDGRVGAIFEDHRGNFWVGTAGDGLHKMDRQKGTFQRHRYDPAHPDRLSRPPLKEPHAWVNDILTFIQEDAAGDLWIGTTLGGLNRYDPQTEKTTHYQTLRDDSASAKGPLNIFSRAAVSREGVLWIGTWSGLYRIDPLRKNIPHLVTGSPVSSIYQDTTGVLWLGTGQGLLRHDRRTGNMRRYVHDPNNPLSLSNNHVSAIYGDRLGNLWVGTSEGLNRFDRKTGTFTRYRHKPQEETSLGHHEVSALYEDRQGSFWIATGKGGLNRMDRRTGTFTRYLSQPKDTQSLSSNEVSCLGEDRFGYLWVGTYQAGLNRMDPRTGAFRHYLPGADIFGLHIDSDGIVWVGTTRGVYRSNPSLEGFSPFTDLSAGLTETTVIGGILEDNQQALWVNTDVGLFRLNRQRNATSFYGKSRGMKASGVWQANHFKGKGGELLMGDYTGNGYYAFFPEQLTTNTKAPQVVITDFRLGDQVVKPGQGSPLKQPLDQTTTIRLAYHQNVFSFDFAGIHYSSPEENRHLFMLENLDNTWRKAVEEKRAYYYNVPPGEYVFRIKAANSDGVWAEKAMTVIITPPWWRTWWAYLAYALMIGAALVLARRNITRRERLRADFRVQQVEADKLRELDTMKSRFFANLSHEFRTPLALISGIVQKLSTQPAATSELHADYHTIQRYANRLLQLINQLLDLSRLEAGQLQPHPQPGDVTGLLRALAGSLESLAQSKGLSYRYALPLRPLWANFDADKLEKICTNLLGNAIKFTPSGGQVVFSASIENPTPTSCQLKLTVQDTGIGIPAEHLPHIFDRFYQADPSTTRAFEGTGIGLALTRELVELLEGTITVESQVGDPMNQPGSTFTVLLPITLIPQPAIQEATAPRQPEEEAYLEASHETFAKLSTRHPDCVLVVEDNPDLRQFISRQLAEGFTILEAADGQEGLNLALETIPDLIISDVMMPGMDGLTLCQRLKTDERTSHIPVILLTAKADIPSKLSGLELGADDYLTKPFQLEELRMRITNLISQRKQLRERFARQVSVQPQAIEVSSLDDRFLQRVLTVVEAQMSHTDFDVEEFSHEIGLSRTQLYRKLTALTGQAPNEFVRRLRLQRAAALLGEHQGNVGEVAMAVGFNSLNYFTRCFREQFGQTPSEYLRQHSDENPR